MKRLTPSDLVDNPQFVLIDAFHIDEMGAFLLREIQTKPPTNLPASGLLKYILVGIMLVLGLGIGYWVGSFLPHIIHDSNTIFQQIGLGLVVFFVLILPLHELIHGIVFKLLKAPKVGFGWTWKGMMAYAYAQKFVINLQELIWVAIMPFTIITSLLIVLLLVFPHYFFAIVLLLLIHTFGCVGDFILIKYAIKNKHREIYTFDDIDEKQESYFYEKIA